jgi:hypothetical protein
MCAASLRLIHPLFRVSFGRERIMKPRLSATCTVYAVCVLFMGLFRAESLAQEVYVTPGENGPVFSDQPQAGSEEVNLRPLTVIPAPPKPAPADEAAKTAPGGSNVRREERSPRETAVPYRNLEVVAPADGGSVAGDTSFLEVRLAVDPPLQLADGHAFVVSIDGRSVDQRFTATDFMIPPEFWPEGYLPANHGVQLDVAVIDANGQVVMRASPVHFRSRPVMFLPQPYPAPPWGRPLPPMTRPGARPPVHPGARPGKPPGPRPAGRPDTRPKPPGNGPGIWVR